jgi:prepilin-type N-terminal cleavage/methylation domain-containing protein
MTTKGIEGARSSPRGFSLVEVLIVVFLLGVLAAIGTISILPALKKGRLEQAGESVRGVVGGARAQAAMNQCFVFIMVGPSENTNLPKRLEVVVDRNRNMVPDDANNFFTAGAGSMNEDILFSTVAVDQVETNWPLYTGPRTDSDGNSLATPYDNQYRALVVNATGKTFNPDGAMVTATQTLTLTHRDMVAGSLRPLQRRVIRVGPLFSVTVTRE